MRRLKLLAVAVALLLAQQVVSQDVYRSSEGETCGPEGTAASDAGKALNRHKNRYQLPTDDTIDRGVSLAALLAPGDDVDRFDEEKAARVTGFVVAVRLGGLETCNCGAAEPVDRDTLIELALAKDAPRTQRVIAEVTPRLRARLKEKGVDWSTETLQDPDKGIKGKWVEVTGWLLFDAPEVDEAENTNPGNGDNRRATCWEIHPVTAIKVLGEPAAQARELQPGILGAFHNVTALALKRDAQKRDALRKRNEMLLSKFTKKELEEGRR